VTLDDVGLCVIGNTLYVGAAVDGGGTTVGAAVPVGAVVGAAVPVGTAVGAAALVGAVVDVGLVGLIVCRGGDGAMVGAEGTASEHTKLTMPVFAH
jgi:hypothetical protein